MAVIFINTAPCKFRKSPDVMYMYQLITENNKSINKNKQCNMEKTLKAKMLLASVLLLGCTATLVSCDDDDDTYTPPTETTAASVYGKYTGTMNTSTVSAADADGSGDGELTGTAVAAEVKDDTIYFDSFPIKGIVMSVVGSEALADQIVEAVGDVSYKIGYKATVNEAKDSVMLALDPKPLTLSVSIPATEEGGEAQALDIEVKVSAVDGANYEGKTTNLKFKFCADEVLIGSGDSQTALPGFEKTTFDFSMKKGEE